MHENEIIHCEMLIGNMLFHRNGNFLYNGVCDWGMASLVYCTTPLYYGYNLVKELQKEGHQNPSLDPTLFYLQLKT